MSATRARMTSGVMPLPLPLVVGAGAGADTLAGAATGAGAAATEAFAQGGEDFDLLDRVDAEFALKVHVRVEHVDRIAGLVGHDGLDECDRVLIA